MKNDPAHQATDAVIAEIEKKITKEYKKAHKEVAAKMDDYLARFATKDATWQKWVSDGTKTQADYAAWKKGQVFMGQRWADLKDTLAKDYANAAKISQSIANGYRPEVYAINHNYATFEIEKGSKLNTSYTLYSKESVERMYRDNPRLYHKPGQSISEQIKEGKLARWDKRRIQSVITQGILQGESIPDLTKRLEKVTGGDHAAAIRNIRTMMTGVENAGRVDAQDRAKSMGIPVVKQWIATLDSRTRHWHRELDGVTAETDEPFENEFGKIMFPGDPDADPANIYNCRCRLNSAIEGHEIDLSDTSLRHDANLEGMSYDEWKNAHREQGEGAEQKNEIEYKSFTTGDDANKYFGQRPPFSLRRENRAEYDRLKEEYENSMYGKWSNNLTTEQTMSIGEYSADGYSGINGLLRHQMTERMVDSWNATTRYSIQDMITHIETAIDDFELKDPIKVYRTCENDVLENLKLSVGSKFHDSGFGSTTTLTKKVASGNVVMEINVPSGKGYGAWINPLSGAQDEEYEFLLQRGSDYVVKSVNKRGADTVVELDLVGNTKSDYSYATKDEVIALWKRNGTYDEFNEGRI